MYPLEKRMRALKDLLALEQSTSKAIPYSSWSSPPEIHFEIEKAKEIYSSLFPKE